MLSGLNHVAMIVSSEATLDFYRKLGFKEVSRTPRPEKGDTLIMMDDGCTTLEVFLKAEAPARHCAPEAYGLRHMAFEVDSLEKVLGALEGYERQDIRISGEGIRFVFVTDPDGQPVEFMEVKQ